MFVVLTEFNRQTLVRQSFTAAFLGLLFLLFSSNINSQIPKDFTRYVKPFIGTGGHGHTFPGATVPLGMVQLSPDTRTDNWDGSSGYHYSDNEIFGFSHTHLSGTGIPDYCDILLSPHRIFDANSDAPQTATLHFAFKRNRRARILFGKNEQRHFRRN